MLHTEIQRIRGISVNEQSRKKKEYANICGNGGGAGGEDGRDKMDQSAAFRRVRVKSVQKRKTEKEKERLRG